jgi:hypothetical protein
MIDAHDHEHQILGEVHGIMFAKLTNYENPRRCWVLRLMHPPFGVFCGCLIMYEFLAGRWMLLREGTWLESIWFSAAKSLLHKVALDQHRPEPL